MADVFSAEEFMAKLGLGALDGCRQEQLGNLSRQQLEQAECLLIELIKVRSFFGLQRQTAHL